MKPELSQIQTASVCVDSVSSLECGGPVQTRTADLYRVKVADGLSSQYDAAQTVDSSSAELSQTQDKTQAIRQNEPPTIELLTFVYVVVSGDLVKVGYSGNPIARARMVVPPVPGVKDLYFTFGVSEPKTARTIESLAHYLLWKYRVADEWFRVSPSVAARTVERAAKLASGPIFEFFPKSLPALATRGMFVPAIRKFKALWRWERQRTHGFCYASSMSETLERIAPGGAR